MKRLRAAPGLELRLRQFIEHEGMPPYGWGERVGISKATLHGILEKGAIPSTRILYLMALNSDLSLNWLLTGNGAERTAAEVGGAFYSRESETAYLVEKEYVLVPRYDVTASAGPGHQVYYEQMVDHLAFKAEWIKRTMGLDENQLALISTKGDSMEPTLKEGDLLLLDLRERQVHNDAVYVLRLDQDLIAKRLQRRFDGSVIIKSDNPAYETQEVPSERADKLGIIGRVVWNGRRL